MTKPLLPRQHSQNAPPSRMTAVVTFYVGIAIVGVIIAAANGSADVYRIDVRGNLQLLLSPVVGAVVGLVIVALSRLATRRVALLRHLQLGFRDVLGPLLHREILVLAVCSSIAEEIFFRGALLPWLGLPWQALLFGLLHIGPDRRFLVWTAMAAVMGLLFGGLTLWLGDIGAATTAHFVVNYLNLRFIVDTPPEVLDRAFGP